MSRRIGGLFERSTRSLIPRMLSVLIIAAGSGLVPVHAWAQTTRAYQMTLLGSVDAQQPDPRPPINYNVGVDIPTFYIGRENAPASGPMIVWLPPVLLAGEPTFEALDWSRVVAVYIDEPYLIPVKNAHTTCNSSTGVPIVQAITNTLQALAASVRTRAPRARFWVNYNWEEVNWMSGSGCELNHDFIDVVSVDRYGITFNGIPGHVVGVRNYYDYLSTHRPVSHQQLALIPGTHVSDEQNASFATTQLAQYFAYAQEQNQSCNLPLGPIGPTGVYDGCPVWMVAGFIGGASVFYGENGSYIKPIEHADSQPIRTAWENNLAIPRSPLPDFSVFGLGWLPAVLKLLLN